MEFKGMVQEPNKSEKFKTDFLIFLTFINIGLTNYPRTGPNVTAILFYTNKLGERQ